VGLEFRELELDGEVADIYKFYWGGCAIHSMVSGPGGPVVEG